MSESEREDTIVFWTWGLAGVPLDGYCEACGGHGSVDSPTPEGHRRECDVCGGSGLVLTEAGETLLRFMERWGAQT